MADRDQIRPDGIDRPLVRRLSPASASFHEVMIRHRDAIVRNRPTYRDPTTGLSVLTAVFLADRGYCCGSGCRHCPYDDAGE